jgi:hypothetical protein
METSNAEKGMEWSKRIRAEAEKGRGETNKFGEHTPSTCINHVASFII